MSHSSPHAPVTGIASYRKGGSCGRGNHKFKQLHTYKVCINCGTRVSSPPNGQSTEEAGGRTDYIFHLSEKDEFKGGIPELRDWLANVLKNDRKGRYRFRNQSPRQIEVGSCILFSMEAVVVGTARVLDGLKTINEPPYRAMLRVDPMSIALFKSNLGMDKVRETGVKPGRGCTPITHQQYLKVVGLADLERLIETMEEDKEYDEGGEQEVVMTVRERDPTLKADAIRKYGSSCRVCGFSFDSKYGKYSEGYIEVHHLKPISTMPRSSKTRLSDIIVVCSNCHRIIHRHKEPLEWRKLKAYLDSQKS